MDMPPVPIQPAVARNNNCSNRTTTINNPFLTDSAGAVDFRSNSGYHDPSSKFGFRDATTTGAADTSSVNEQSYRLDSNYSNEHGTNSNRSTRRRSSSFVTRTLDNSDNAVQFNPTSLDDCDSIIPSNNKQPVKTRGRISSRLPPAPLNAVLLEALDLLRRKDRFEIFHQPVDPIVVPGYLDAIMEPMDFATMETKLRKNQYLKFKDFDLDVELIFSNCKRFNQSSTIFYKQAASLSQWWTKTKRNFKERADIAPAAALDIGNTNLVDTAHTDAKTPRLPFSTSFPTSQTYGGGNPSDSTNRNPPNESLSFSVSRPKETKRHRLPYIKCRHKSSSSWTWGSLGEVLQYHGERGVLEKLSRGCLYRWDTCFSVSRQLRNRHKRELISTNMYTRSNEPKKQKINLTSSLNTSEKHNSKNFGSFVWAVTSFLGPDLAKVLPPYLSALKPLLFPQTSSLGNTANTNEASAASINSDSDRWKLSNFNHSGPVQQNQCTIFNSTRNQTNSTGASVVESLDSTPHSISLQGINSEGYLQPTRVPSSIPQYNWNQLAKNEASAASILGSSHNDQTTVQVDNNRSNHLINGLHHEAQPNVLQCVNNVSQAQIHIPQLLPSADTMRQSSSSIVGGQMTNSSNRQERRTRDDSFFPQSYPQDITKDLYTNGRPSFLLEGNHSRLAVPPYCYQQQ